MGNKEVTELNVVYEGLVWNYDTLGDGVYIAKNVAHAECNAEPSDIQGVINKVCSSNRYKQFREKMDMLDIIGNNGDIDLTFLVDDASNSENAVINMFVKRYNKSNLKVYPFVSNLLLHRDVDLKRLDLSEAECIRSFGFGSNTVFVSEIVLPEHIVKASNVLIIDNDCNIINGDVGVDCSRIVLRRVNLTGELKIQNIYTFDVYKSTMNKLVINLDSNCHVGCNDLTVQESIIEELVVHGDEFRNVSYIKIDKVLKDENKHNYFFTIKADDKVYNKKYSVLDKD